MSEALSLSDVVIVGNSSDSPFAIDVAYAMGQVEDIADLISMKSFANSEFCPRFINDEQDFSAIGSQLEGKTIVIVSTSRLYAEMLQLAGVDRVLTVHNHSSSVQAEFTRVFDGRFHNLIPYDLYADYLREATIVDYGPTGEGLALCAPDKGARDFVRTMFETLDLPDAKFIMLDKERTGERKVEITLHKESDSAFEEIEGHDIVLFDDMVRTGSTVVKSCQFLKQVKPSKTVFAVTHFYASDEGRAKMANVAIDEILTLNTIPTVLNRDVQGRLRKKMVVLKIEQWLAQNLAAIIGLPVLESEGQYQIDMSSKNPRFKHKIWSNNELPSLRD